MPEKIDLSWLEPLLKKYKGTDGALIPVLQEAQGLYGYLPEEVLDSISRALDHPAEPGVRVATFYSQFYLSRRETHRPGLPGDRLPRAGGEKCPEGRATGAGDRGEPDDP